MGRPIVTASRILVVLLLSAVGSIGFVIGAAPAGACSCAPVSDDTAFAQSDAVFTGTIIEHRDPSRSDGRWSSGDPARFVFAVDRVYKGPVFAEQSVVTAVSGSSCGLELTGSGPFLVFTYPDDPMLDGVVDGELISGLCSGTRPLTAAQPVPASFGAGTGPMEAASPIGGGGGGTEWLPWVAGVAGVAVVVAIGGVVAARRRRGVASE